MCTQPDVHSKCSGVAVVRSTVCLCKASCSLVRATAKEQHLLLISPLFFQEPEAEIALAELPGTWGNSQC